MKVIIVPETCIFRSTVAFVVCLITVLASPTAAQSQTGVQVTLLRHRYPYNASLTILSDLHDTTVEEFEAVHTLVNTGEIVRPGSVAWRALGWDGPDGPAEPVRGFSFPFADTFFPFSRQFSLFKRVDANTHVLEFHSADLAPKFLEWHRRGYIDAIHTFGVGNLTRLQMEAATEWMRTHLTRPVLVHVNHSKSRTPAGVGGNCCTLLNQVLVGIRYHGLRVFGLHQGLARPKALPGNLGLIGHSLFAVAVLGTLALGLALLRVGSVGRFSAVGGAVAVAAALATLWAIPVEFHRGDDPESGVYNLDLLRSLGVRYFWLGNTDYYKSTYTSIELPEVQASTRRRSIFRVHEFDDESEGLVFGRNSIGGDARALSLLDERSLRHLISVEGRSIVYLHWLERPETYFDKAGLRQLNRLKAFNLNGQIWLASAERLLSHAYAYAHVLYGVRQQEEDRVAIDVTGFADPVRGFVPAEKEDLRNLSFRCTNASAVVVTVAGEELAATDVETVSMGQDIIVTILPSENARTGEPGGEASSDGVR